MITPTDLIDIRRPSCEKGIGAVIAAPDSRHLIEGVRVEHLAPYADDRGYFFEIGRLGQGLLDAYPAESTQVSCAVGYQGTIKAFHYHRLQTDVWAVVRGMLQVALVDLRPSSPTFGVRNTIYLGQMRPWTLLIPPGVGHGYKVIGTEAAVLVYLTDRVYNPEDEGRIPYNDGGISYDWEVQHK
jgi:dTDP-4-dehydrorhamnose 3,5-epimerase